MTKPISLVERLRAVNKSWIEVYMNDKPAPALSETINTTIQAADEIERLQARVEALERLLRSGRTNYPWEWSSLQALIDTALENRSVEPE